MPNWCENELYIEGPKEELDRFKREAAGENGCLDMNAFIPYPVQFLNQDKIFKLSIDEAIAEAEAEGEVLSKEQKAEVYFRIHKDLKDGFNSGGYEWCVKNWGTKWNFCDPTLAREDDDSLYYEFATAWSPPEPVIRKMGERFPMLLFELRYFEGAMEFNGILEIEGGQVVRDVCAPYFGHRGG